MVALPADRGQWFLGHDGFLQELGSFSPLLAEVSTYPAVVQKIIRLQKCQKISAATTWRYRGDTKWCWENEMKRHVYSETLTELRHGPREQPCVEEKQLEEEEGLWKYLGNEGDCRPESFPPF